MSSDAQDPIPLCAPRLGGNEEAYLRECVATNWVSSAGPFVERFERDVAAYVGTAHAVSTVNGTAALHIALKVAGVGPGDAVVTSTLTFVATANAIVHAGARPVFVDVEPATWQMDPALVETYLREGCTLADGILRDRETGLRVAALLPVHILGHPVDMDPILALAREFGLPVVEDATESLGATYRGRNVGTLGDIAALSFNGNKLITCGGGGMVVTDRAAWADRARHLTTQARIEPLEAIHDEVGYNYRLTNIQAALGCAQLETIDERIADKRRIADLYRGLAAEVPGLTFMPAAPWAGCTYWMSTVLVDPDVFGVDRYHLLRFLSDHNIGARPLWQPLHLSPAHEGARSVKGLVAEGLYTHAVSLPSSCGLSDAQWARVRSAIFAAAELPNT